MRFAEREALVPLVLGFNISLLLFWRIRGLLRSGMRRLKAALTLVDDPASTERGMVLTGLAHYGQLLGELGLATARAAESEAIFEAAGDLVSLRTVIGFRGDIAADLGDVDAALAHYARARAGAAGEPRPSSRRPRPRRSAPRPDGRLLASSGDDPDTDPPRGRGAELTPREREVAQLVALGLTNRQIAEQLVIAPGTARTHVERILGKLGLTSRVQIATWVIRGPDAAVAP